MPSFLPEDGKEGKEEPKGWRCRLPFRPSPQPMKRLVLNFRNPMPKYGRMHYLCPH